MSREQKIIEQAGGTYLGMEDRLVWFNEPETHSTMTVSLAALGCLEDFSAVALVRILMADKRRGFSDANHPGCAARNVPSLVKEGSSGQATSR